MSFRKNSILFYENIILLAALSLLMIAVGLVTNFPHSLPLRRSTADRGAGQPEAGPGVHHHRRMGHFLQRGGPAALELRLGAYRRIAEKLPVSPPLRRGDPLRCVRPAGAICFGPALFPIGPGREKGAVHVLCQSALSANIEQDFFHSPTLSSSRRSISAERSKSICRMSSMGILTPLRMITSRWYSSIFPILPVSVRYAPPSFRWSGLK